MDPSLFKISFFSLQDTQGVIDLWSNNKFHLKEPVTEFDILLKLKKYQESPEKSMLTVVSYNSQVVGTFGAFLWSTIPYFTLLDVCIVQKKSYQFSINTLNAGLDYLFSHLHKSGIFTFLFLTISRPQHVREFKRGLNPYVSKHVPLLQKYNFEIEEIVPPNSVPNSDLFYEMMGRRTFPREIWVRRGGLQQKYRNTYFGIQGIIPLDL